MKISFLPLSLIFTLFLPLLGFGSTSSFNSGNCLSFNGTSSLVSFTNNDLGLASGNTMTVMAWVKWGDKNNAGQWANLVTLDANTSSGDNGQFWLQHSQNNSNFEFAIQTNSARTYIQSVTNPVVGQWYHVAGVYDGSFINIYVNGIQEARVACSGNIATFQSAFRLIFGQWAYSGNGYRPFNGNLDEISIWNVALSQTSIRNNLCKKLAGTEAGLLGYWRMNETTGNTVNDFTSNKRNGTSVNTNIVYSGAPIGDDCTYTYGGSALSFKHPLNFDSLKVSAFSSPVSGIYIYRVDTACNSSTLPSGISYLFNDYYFGVFIVNASGQTYQTTWYYKGHPGTGGVVGMDIVSRSDNSVLTFTDIKATLNSTAINYLYNGTQSNRNEYLLSMTNGALPIELLNFDAVLKNESVQVNWTTETEVNNAFFTIEKSLNGKDYESIATVKGRINSLVQNHYSILDPNPVSGTS